MKRLVMVFLVAMAVLVPVSLWAADVPKADVFAGFSVQSLKDSGPGATRLTPLGWQAAVTGNVTKMFGITGDISGTYKNDSTNCPKCKFYTYTVGPQVATHLDKATVFAHALFGGTHLSGTGFSENDFTMAYGGGIDVKATDNISIRVIQFDWLPVRDSGPPVSWLKNNTRYGFGVVFHAGK